MPVFRMLGKEWQVTLDAPKIKAVRQSLEGFDILDDEAFAKLANDPVSLVDVLWVLCRQQADGAGLSPDKFGESLVGDAIDDATKALIDARVDFFPAGKRSLLRSLADKQAKVDEAAKNLAMAELNDPNLEAKILEATKRQMRARIDNLLTSLSSATSSPESSASTQRD